MGDKDLLDLSTLLQDTGRNTIPGIEEDAQVFQKKPGGKQGRRVAGYLEVHHNT